MVRHPGRAVAAVAEIESVVQPDRIADYIRRKSMAFICIHPRIVSQDELSWQYLGKRYFPELGCSSPGPNDCLALTYGTQLESSFPNGTREWEPQLPHGLLQPPAPEGDDPPWRFLQVCLSNRYFAPAGVTRRSE